MDCFRQTSIKISCSTEVEFLQKINSLGAVFSMGVSVYPTTANATDLKQWYIVHYWVRDDSYLRDMQMNHS